MQAKPGIFFLEVERLKKYDSMCAEELLEIVKGTPLRRLLLYIRMNLFLVVLPVHMKRIPVYSLRLPIARDIGLLLDFVWPCEASELTAPVPNSELTAAGQ